MWENLVDLQPQTGGTGRGTGGGISREEFISIVAKDIQVRGSSCWLDDETRQLILKLNFDKELSNESVFTLSPLLPLNRGRSEFCPSSTLIRSPRILAYRSALPPWCSCRSWRASTFWSRKWPSHLSSCKRWEIRVLSAKEISRSYRKLERAFWSILLTRQSEPKR